MGTDAVDTGTEKDTTGKDMDTMSKGIGKDSDKNTDTAAGEGGGVGPAGGGMAATPETAAAAVRHGLEIIRLRHKRPRVGGGRCTR